MVIQIILLLISEDDSGHIRIKKSHHYWHQVQGQLYLTDTTCCDFIVWTTKDFRIVRVVRDVEWFSYLEMMENFYFNTFVEALWSFRLGYIVFTPTTYVAEFLWTFINSNLYQVLL